MTLVNTYRQPLPFAILSPKHCPPRFDPAAAVLPPEQWEAALDSIRPDEVVALDFETNHTDPTLDGTQIVGTGLAWSGGLVYMHRELNPQLHDFLVYTMLAGGQPVVGHNMYFDGQWAHRKLGVMPNIRACTYALYRHLATEGWAGQKWGLGESQTQLLLWEQSNKSMVEEWLVENGYTTRPVPKHLLEKLKKK